MTTTLYLLACCLLFYSAFCRLVLVHPGTLLRVRLVFIGMAMAAALAIGGVLVWGHVPSLFDLALVLAFAAVLLVSSRRWRLGVPSEYESSRGEFDSRPETAESRP